MKKFSSLLIEYERYYLGLGVKSAYTQIRWLKKFYEHLESINKTDLRTVKKTDIMKYIDIIKGTVSEDTKKPYAMTTVANVFHIIKNFYNFLYTITPKNLVFLARKSSNDLI